MFNPRLAFTNTRGAPRRANISQIVLGGPFGERPDAVSFRILDRFAECGGETIETANAYADGAAEKQIGRWLKASGLGSSIKIVDKCCHPDKEGQSRVNGGAMRDDVVRSLERLSLCKIDLMLLHRDDEKADLDSLLDAANDLVERGLAASYGLSNWSPGRFVQAASRAKVRGLCCPSVASLQFSLAVPAAPLWPGALSASENDVRELTAMGFTFIAWSSLARGWFARRDGATAQRPAETAFFDTPRNWRRLERCRLLGGPQGFSPIQIALAYVLGINGVAASIGPASLAELEESLRALTISLSEGDRRYLMDSASGTVLHTT
jgi:aryl-alcohol dehydrogenase-like predicted oxidoreductase